MFKANKYSLPFFHFHCFDQSNVTWADLNPLQMESTWDTKRLTVKLF